MSKPATGTFKVGSWDESAYRELGGGAKLTRATITFDYHGDMEARGSSELLMCYERDGKASYLGLEHFAGKLDGRSGSFVAQSHGTFDGQDARTTWTVVLGSATGELAGLSGGGTSVAGHGPGGSFTFDHQLP
jgi:hypothetical protein